jgi:ABC-type transport system substrate-binding protein
VPEEEVPDALVSVREYRAMFPGTEITAQNNGDAMLARFDGRLRPSPPRWSGNQGGWYANPALDALIDKLYATLDLQEQGRALNEIGEIMAADLPCLPLYFGTNLAGIRKGVRALTDDFAGAYLGGPGVISRNAHLWDRD